MTSPRVFHMYLYESFFKCDSRTVESHHKKLFVWGGGGGGSFLFLLLLGSFTGDA